MYHGTAEKLRCRNDRRGSPGKSECESKIVWAGRCGKLWKTDGSGKKIRKRAGLTEDLDAASWQLFERLRQLRLTIAGEQKVPPYIVFSDKTLIDMCVKKPTDRASMLEVSGVGEAKYEKYGERFLEELAKK